MVASTDSMLAGCVNQYKDNLKQVGASTRPVVKRIEGHRGALRGTPAGQLWEDLTAKAGVDFSFVSAGQ